MWHENSWKYVIWLFHQIILINIQILKVGQLLKYERLMLRVNSAFDNLTKIIYSLDT